MKKTLKIILLGLLLALPAGLTYAEERPMEKAPRDRGGEPMMQGRPDGWHAEYAGHEHDDA